MRGISCKRALEIETKERDAVHRVGKTVEVSKEIAEEVYRLHGIINIQAERLCELDEKNQTQALVLAARDVVINRLEDQFRDATKMIEQQKVAIDKAVEIIGNAFCLEDGPCPENYVKTGCKPCVLKWIGMEEKP